MPAFPALPALPTLPAFPATIGALPYAAPEASPALTSIAGPTLWWVTIAAVVGLLALDFVITRRPHEVTMREALAWSAFYIAIPVGFGVWIWTTHGHQTGLEYYTGYLVEKSLSVDHLFIFILILSSFAVPRVLQQRALLFGIIGALVMRGIFIALVAALIARFSWMFPVSYTQLRAHETVLALVCRLLLEQKKKKHITTGWTAARRAPRSGMTSKRFTEQKTTQFLR